jgi:pyruvate/2-oxoglutarate dehydrogenase complex dihydrolipoamide dehydrogenase (E3) component
MPHKVSPRASIFSSIKTRSTSSGNCLLVSEHYSAKLNEGGESTVEGAKNVIRGSEVTLLPGGAIEIDEEQVVSSTGAISLQSVLGKLVVIGGTVLETM